MIKKVLKTGKICNSYTFDIISKDDKIQINSLFIEGLLLMILQKIYLDFILIYKINNTDGSNANLKITDVLKLDILSIVQDESLNKFIQS